MENKRQVLKGVYFAIGYYFFSFVVAFLLLGVGGGGPCNAGLVGITTGAVLFGLALLAGIGCLFSKRPFYRGMGISFCVGSFVIFLLFKIIL